MKILFSHSRFAHCTNLRYAGKRAKIGITILSNQKLLMGFATVIFVLMMARSMSMTALAGNASWQAYNAGIASILDPASYDEEAISLVALPTPTIAQPEKESDLVMANVQNAMNVRTEANEESEKIGMLYKDCGGRILERKDGWTKIQSGDLTGWAKDEYLLFGDEAEALANDVGNMIVRISTDALRVRKEPNMDAGVYGLVAQDDELIVVDEIDENWYSVDYEGNTGYVSREFVSADFEIDAGETIEAIKERERKEAEEKAKRSTNQGAVVVGADDTRLLAALIQCESGGEPYEGQLAVGAVVMNRVRSGGYPGTVTGVIYASGQFSPALSGKVARVYSGNVKDSCLQAAASAIAGDTNIGAATHFRRAGSRDGVVIGNHVFW